MLGRWRAVVYSGIAGATSYAAYMILTYYFTRIGGWQSGRISTCRFA